MISTSTTILRDAISRARLLAARNSAMPIYANVVIRARTEDAWLTVTAAGTDAEVSLDVEADIDEPMALCVDADRFALAVAVPGEKTKLSVEGERLKIATGKSVFRLPHQPTENFPILLSSGNRIAAFECAWLGADFKRVLPFTGSSDHVRVDFRGISMKAEAGKMKIEGTDGHVCAQIVRDVSDQASFSVMLPRRVCEVIASLEPNRAVLKEGTALFLGENLRLTTVYLQAQLADTSNAFPTKGTTFTVPRKDFIEALKSVAAISDVMLKRVHPVKLTVDGTDTLAIEALGQSGEGRAEVPASGEKWDGLYDSALVEALAESVDGDDLTLRAVGGPERLGVDSDNFRAVVTGMRR